MAGTWETENQELPGVYLNIKTKEPLSIIPGERGTVVLLQEMSVGTDEAMYTITATDAAYPEDASSSDKKLTIEALKNAKSVILYKLPENHTDSDVEKALAALYTVDHNVLCYPYDGADKEAAKMLIVAWTKSMYGEEGTPVQAVMTNVEADSDRILNVVQGIVLKDGSELTAAETTAWVAGATAGAGITTSNVGKKYIGAIDVKPRMKRTEMETASKAGKFLFKVDNLQNVTVVSDINSLTTYTEEKGKQFRKNRVIRTLDSIKKDIGLVYEGDYMGKFDNEQNGQTLLKGSLCSYFAELQKRGAIQNFVTDDITVVRGVESDAVVITVAVQPVDSMEKFYITVNLS